MNAPMLPVTTTYAELRKVNVSEFVEKKNNLSYLSWAWAVDQLLQRDPGASWEYRWHDNRPFVSIGETAMVFCTVKAFGTERTAFLPVMDYKNRPIPNPNSFEVNTAMQRALAKAISLHGLGLYIYAGEDLPPGEEGEKAPETPQKAPSAVSGQTVKKEEGWDKLSEEERNHVFKLASSAADLIQKGCVSEAWDELTAAIPYAPPHRKDNYVELWNGLLYCLDSKSRSAIFKHRETLKKAA